MLRMLCHSKTPTQAFNFVTANAELARNGELLLQFHVDAGSDRILLPDVEMPSRADELWRTTCFEAFVASCNDKQYLEFNFSPSLQWAAYCFQDYREAMRNLELPDVPKISIETTETQMALTAKVQLPANWCGRSIVVGLTAVIEEIDGPKSFWALKHNQSVPDFHDRACFSLQLDAAA